MGFFERRRKEKAAREQSEKAAYQETSASAAPDTSELTPTDLLLKGIELYNAKNYSAAFEYFLKGAKQDDITCISNVAMCICAELVDQYKASDCIVWVKKLKELGQGDMVLSWYKNPETGENLTVDGFLEYVEGLAHETLTPEEKYQQGRKHDNFSGMGIQNPTEPDKEKAFVWYKEAAEAGHLIAQNLTGLCYHCGYGVKQNHEEALRWYAKAAFHEDFDETTADYETRQGQEAAEKNLRLLYRQMPNFSELLFKYAPEEDAEALIDYIKLESAFNESFNTAEFQDYFNKTMDDMRKKW